MKIFIKNMVCNRCIMVVKQELEKFGLQTKQVNMGEVDLIETPTPNQLEQLDTRLKQLGFELLDDQRQKQIEKIKKLLIEKTQSGELEEHFSISEYLGKAFNKEYSSISRLFSQVEGITIEQFFILQKIEKVKEWLLYGEMNLNEIAFQLGYSSTAHVSTQFKKVTGLSPREFKTMGGSRKPLDEV
jgi:AraC family transcriptional regulator